MVSAFTDDASIFNEILIDLRITNKLSILSQLCSFFLQVLSVQLVALPRSKIRQTLRKTFMNS